MLFFGREEQDWKFGMDGDACLRKDIRRHYSRQDHFRITHLYSPDLLSKSPVLSDKMSLDKTECVHVQGDRGILGMQGRRSNRGVTAS